MEGFFYNQLAEGLLLGIFSGILVFVICFGRKVGIDWAYEEIKGKLVVAAFTMFAAGFLMMQSYHVGQMNEFYYLAYTHNDVWTTNVPIVAPWGYLLGMLVTTTAVSIVGVSFLSLVEWWYARQVRMSPRNGNGGTA